MACYQNPLGIFPNFFSLTKLTVYISMICYKRLQSYQVSPIISTGWFIPNVLTSWGWFSAICGWIPKPFQPCFAMIPRFYMPYELHWSVGYCLGKMRALIFMIFPFAIFLLPAVSSQEQQWSLHMAPVFIFTPFSDALATGTVFSLKWVQCHDQMRKEMQDLKKFLGKSRWN